ncbi:MAG: hypothetical protein IPK14_23900 [Blastocatellia bacterium]|nr:hypothetical protein [Blastocatellia bacterium]
MSLDSDLSFGGNEKTTSKRFLNLLCCKLVLTDLAFLVKETSLSSKHTVFGFSDWFLTNTFLYHQFDS